ncbi:hypothetical protein LguiB_002016 [Lonicera macranthoides]
MAFELVTTIKFNFLASFAMNMLSWSVIEYSAKYEAAGELNRVKEIIKWGTNYFLKTFNHFADTIDSTLHRGLVDLHGISDDPLFLWQLLWLSKEMATTLFLFASTEMITFASTPVV